MSQGNLLSGLGYCSFGEEKSLELILVRNKGYLQGKMQLFGYFLCVDLSTTLPFEVIGGSPRFEQNSGCNIVFAFFSALDEC